MVGILSGNGCKTIFMRNEAERHSNLFTGKSRDSSINNAIIFPKEVLIITSQSRREPLIREHPVQLCAPLLTNIPPATNYYAHPAKPHTQPYLGHHFNAFLRTKSAACRVYWTRKTTRSSVMENHKERLAVECTARRVASAIWVSFSLTMRDTSNNLIDPTRCSRSTLRTHMQRNWIPVCRVSDALGGEALSADGMCSNGKCNLIAPRERNTHT